MTRAKRFRRNDTPDIVLDQFAEERREFFIGHQLQVAQCLLVHLVSTAFIRIVVANIADARYTERNSICQGVTGQNWALGHAFAFSSSTFQHTR